MGQQFCKIFSMLLIKMTTSFPPTIPGSMNLDTLSVSDLVATSGGLTIRTKANVTQITSITTAVTADANSGTITTFSATTASGATSVFTVNNTQCTANSRVYLQEVSYSGTAVTTQPKLSVSATAAGSFNVTILNNGSGALDGVIVFNYLVVG